MKMFRFSTSLLLLLLCLGSLQAQQWGKYTLFSENGSNQAKLVDTANSVFHTWNFANAPTGYSTYLLPNQILCRSVQVNNPFFQGGGQTGRIQKVDWNGNVLWDYTNSTSTTQLHHDHCVLPNGNVLVICYEIKSVADVIAAGCTQSIEIHSEKILELEPTGLNTQNVVWEWHLWDHLVQNANPAKANYQPSIIDHPELLNVNYQTQEDWIHMNGIDYNATLDQIVLSTHYLNEVYIIDHSTTTAEAASHTGGNSGMGGDFLYRWGNPAAYQAAGPTVFDVLHDAHWIPADCPNAGRIAAFHNDWSTMTQSSVIQFDPPVNGYNYTGTPGAAYGPTTYSDRRTLNGWNSNMGNSQQLPNGNTLVCMAMLGTIYEIGPTGNTLWTRQLNGSCSQAFRYTDCYVNGGTPPSALVTALQDSVCPLDSVQLDLTPSGGSNYTYIWSSSPSGFTSTLQNPIVTPSVSSVYQVTITSAGCSATQTVAVTVVGPARPTITFALDTLHASAAVGYQWFLNGAAISGATSQFYVPTQSGSYTVVTTGSNGCESVASLPRVVTLVGIDHNLAAGWAIYPNPSNGVLRIAHPASADPGYEVSIADAQGRRVAAFHGSELLDLSSLQSGMYFVRIHQGDAMIITQKIALIR
jgi:Arylsulfotransferase (ASST)/Secretion system C-terminal sorting domain